MLPLGTAVNRIKNRNRSKNGEKITYHKGSPIQIFFGDRQKDEEKRRKKEEKEAAKRLKERDANELRKARERDAMANERRKSFNEPGYPNMQSGYNPNLYNYSPAGGPADLDRRFGDMGIDKQSPLGRPRKYSSNEGDPTAGGAHSISPYGSPYANPGYPANTRSSTYPSYGPASSPNARPTDFPPRSTTPVPGPAAGIGMPQPTIPNTGGPPYTSPVTFGAEQPQQLAAPEAFSRPVNAAQPYTPFETTKIQDMDDFPDNMPRLPLALQSHDVFHEDWIRLMQVCGESVQIIGEVYILATVGHYSCLDWNTSRS